MMRKFLAFFCAALVIYVFASVPARAANLLFDDFESGVSSSVWTQVAVAGQSLLQGDTGGHHLGVQSAKQVNAFTDGVSDVYYMRNKPGTVTVGTVAAGNREIAKVQFWDENIRTDTSGDSAINIAGAIMLANSAGSDFYQVGVNNAVSLTNYYIRTSIAGNSATSVARTQGWHELRIDALPYTGTNDVEFYIDGALVGTGSRRPNVGSGFNLDEVRLGISVRTPDSPFWFDNVSLDMVPEPTSVLLLSTGCLAIAACSRRRRRGRCA
jgi:hypothetical protein